MNLVFDESKGPIRVRFGRPVTDVEMLRFSAKNETARVERDSNGDLIVTSAGFSEGAAMEGDVYLEFGMWARTDGRGKAFSANAGFTLPDGSVRAADVAWVRWVRWNALTDKERNSFAPICPEFVIEVRSATDRLTDLRKKMVLWLRNGVELGWLIDPKRRVVEVYRVGEAAEVLEDPSSVLGTGCVAGFCLVMQRVWG